MPSTLKEARRIRALLAELAASTAQLIHSLFPLQPDGICGKVSSTVFRRTQLVSARSLPPPDAVHRQAIVNRIGCDFEAGRVRRISDYLLSERHGRLRSSKHRVFSTHSYFSVSQSWYLHLFYQ